MSVYANTSSGSESPDVPGGLSGSSSRPLCLKACDGSAQKLTAKFAKESQSSQIKANLCELCGCSLRPLRFKIF
jgi:hypothetical protein